MNRAERINSIVTTLTASGWTSLSDLIAPIQFAYADKGAGFDAALRALNAAERAGLIVRRSKDYGATLIAGYIVGPKAAALTNAVDSQGCSRGTGHGDLRRDAAEAA